MIDNATLLRSTMARLAAEARGSEESLWHLADWRALVPPAEAALANLGIRHARLASTGAPLSWMIHLRHVPRLMRIRAHRLPTIESSANKPGRLVRLSAATSPDVAQVTRTSSACTAARQCSSCGV